MASRHRVLADLIPLAAGHFPHAAGHFIRRRAGLKEAILLWCAQGTGWCRLGGRAYEIRSAEGLLLPAGVPHAYGSVPRQPWSLFWVHMGGRRLPDHLALLGLAPLAPLFRVNDIGAVASSFEDLLRRFGLGFTVPGLAARAAALAALLAEIAAHRETPRGMPAESRERVRASIAFMTARLSRSVRVEDLARGAGLSTPHFAALFRREFGCGPIAYFIRLKMQEACRALAHGDEPVQAIAARLGYADPFHFSRTFRRLHGAPPTAYRERHRG